MCKWHKNAKIKTGRHEMPSSQAQCLQRRSIQEVLRREGELESHPLPSSSTSSSKHAIYKHAKNKCSIKFVLLIH